MNQLANGAPLARRGGSVIEQDNAAAHTGRVISLDLARRLRDAGLEWSPAPGDRFVVADRDMDSDVFVLSDMTIEVHDLPHARVIGFNGTTEWALDSVVSDEAVWLPRETQLRELLAAAFRGLDRAGDDWQVRTQVNGTVHASQHPDAEQAYGLALLHLLTSR
ncbi:MAG: hypothetical protein QOF87_1239 [Pseudonocardiales bacterium]|jgi:hypothetical protein|nr:hypothetical protein [Pseudonocardiales bacterium]